MAQVTEVLKYEGGNSTFIRKHPCEDFNTLTQLIVHESQEAIFMMNGQALDLFGAGRHTLETENIPLLSRLLNRVTGNDTSPFHAEVYYKNEALSNVEGQITIKFSELKSAVSENNLETVKTICNELNILLIDRNNKCKLLK